MKVLYCKPSIIDQILFKDFYHKLLFDQFGEFCISEKDCLILNNATKSSKTSTARSGQQKNLASVTAKTTCCKRKTSVSSGYTR